jgi:hypothetical protein
MSTNNPTALPAQMRFIDHGKGGAPDVLAVGLGPLPVPGADEVMIRVAYAGVNRPDVLQRGGSYPPPPGASAVPGARGVRRSRGNRRGRAAQWKAGDQVCALTNGGGYAEYVNGTRWAGAAGAARLSMLQAAALPETYFTVWANVFERGGLKAPARRCWCMAARRASASPRSRWPRPGAPPCMPRSAVRTRYAPACRRWGPMRDQLPRGGLSLPRSRA